MAIEKRLWSLVSDEQISVPAIRAMHLPMRANLLFPDRYEAGTSFASHHYVPHMTYVLEGTCQFILGEEAEALVLSAGEFAEITPGYFDFNVLGDARVRLVKVIKVTPV